MGCEVDENNWPVTSSLTGKTTESVGRLIGKELECVFAEFLTAFCISHRYVLCSPQLGLDDGMVY